MDVLGSFVRFERLCPRLFRQILYVGEILGFVWGVEAYNLREWVKQEEASVFCECDASTSRLLNMLITRRGKVIRVSALL